MSHDSENHMQRLSECEKVNIINSIEKMTENRNWLMATIIILAEIFCRDMLFDIVNSYLLCHLGWMKSTPLNDVLIILIGVVLFIWNLCRPKTSIVRRTKFWKWVFAVMLVLFYIYLRIVHSEVITSFYISEKVYYSDILLLVVVLWCFDLTIVWNCWGGNIAFENKVGDVASAHIIGEGTFPKEDLLERAIEVKTVYAYLTNKDNDYSEALAVAITGSWGSGKTTFLHQLQTKFKQDGVRFFEYSPWHKSSDDVTVDFLKHLREYLSEEGFSFEALNRYITSLRVSNVTNWFSWIVHTMIYFWSGENCITKQIEYVKEEMSGLPQPVYAFIDDIDRVDTKDLYDVMALVRSTASFPNLVYIVAYDREITAKMLEKEYGEKYLSKIFNASFGLLAIEEEQMQKLVTDIIYKNFPEMNSGAPDVYSPFEGIKITHFLPTLRELYRYLNLFAKDYEAMVETRRQTWFDYELFALLELLKYSDMLTWEMLKAKPSAFLHVDDGDWVNFSRYKLKDKLTIDNANSLTLLKYIFQDARNSESEFLSPEGLKMMFLNKLSPEYITKDEFKEAIKIGRLVDYAEFWAVSKDNLFFCLGHHLDLPIDTIFDVCMIGLLHRPIALPFSEKLKPEAKSHPLASFSMIRITVSPYTYIELHHELYLLLEQKMINDTDGLLYSILEMKAKKTNNPREMLAIVYGMMQIEASYGSKPEKWKYKLIKILFERLVGEYDMNDLEHQYVVAEAIEFLTVYDYVNIMVKPLLENNLELWLRLTIRVDDDIAGNSIITVNPCMMRTMFDTMDQYQKLMREMQIHFAADKVRQSLIGEHMRLTNNTALITALQKNNFDLVKYPHLDAIRSKNQMESLYTVPFYDGTKALFQQGIKPFFNNESRQWLVV